MERLNDVYLSLLLRKSEGGTDEYGNYIFEVEASNENLDLQNQVVLQNALLESKDEFLRGGVISYGHMHKRRDKDGCIISDPSMIIGEPIDVKTDGTKTIVVGKLYAHNEKAKELINMLKDGSTRIRASVGGILPQIVKNAKTGVEKITRVLWNDLALTTSPVNNTVGAAVFAKSMNSVEFVKALNAGYETDSAQMTGGRVLVPEDAGEATVEVGALALSREVAARDGIRALTDAIAAGAINGEEEAVAFLIDGGLDGQTARDIAREIIEQGGEMMKKSFSKTVREILKSLKSGEAEDEEDKIDLDEEDEGEEDGGEYVEVEDEGAEDGGEDEVDEDDDEIDDDEVEEDEEEVDGAPILKSLGWELARLNKAVEAQSKTLEDIGRAVVGLAETAQAIGGERTPPRSTLAKSFTGGVKKSAASEIPSENDFNKAQELLIRAVREGRIDMFKSSQISSDLQKSMATGKPMRSDFYAFLMDEYKREER